jgi:peptidoglycan/xylan/chitin deacetylase (PgdA/CDA1 family)
LLVITHHRIGYPSKSPYYGSIFSASPEIFREQVCYLRTNFRILTLSELDTPAAFKEPSVLIAFDDGYRDNFEVAFPILKELGVPATFFIPTGFLEIPRLPWWDHAAYVLGQTAQTEIVLDWPKRMTIQLDSEGQTRAIWSVISLYLDGKIDDEPQFRAHLEERSAMTVDEAMLGRDLFMTWDQVRLLARAGMSIGSHSHNHPMLAKLSGEQQQAELKTSKAILERELGSAVSSVAYPFGWEGAYNEITKLQAHTAGYRLAFSAKKGINRPGEHDQFALCRISVGFEDTPLLLRARSVCYSAFGFSLI